MLEENVVRKDIRSIEGDDKLSPMSRKNVQMQFPNEICPTTSVSAWPWDVLLPDIMRFHLREGQKRLVRIIRRLRSRHGAYTTFRDSQYGQKGYVPSGKLKGVCRPGNSGLAHDVKESR